MFHQQNKENKPIMRQLFDPQKVLDFFSPFKSKSKVIKQFEKKYEKISQLLDDNISMLKAIGKDLSYNKKLKIGRKGYTVEQAFRCILIKKLEGLSYREAVIAIHDSYSFRKFCRLENSEVMDYTELNKLTNRISPETWDKINALLNKYAIDNEMISGDKLRSDTTAVETNVHYPTDSHLLWDVYRVLYSFIKAIRKIDPELVGEQRFHLKPYKKIYFNISRLAGHKNKKLEIEKLYKQLIPAVERIIFSTEEIIEKAKEEIKLNPVCDYSLKLNICVLDTEPKIKDCKRILDQTKRRIMEGEKVPNGEKIFSLFEPHTELLKRGKAGKPIEFGHMVLLNQVEEKYITGYEVFEKRPNENRLVDGLLKSHKKLFGDYPDLFAADKGFYSGMDQIGKLEKKIGVVAIGKKGRLNEKEKERESTDEYKKGCYFRAGIEGTISVLKRILNMGRCMNKGFDRFRNFVSGTIFAHNLRILATL